MAETALVVVDRKTRDLEKFASWHVDDVKYTRRGYVSRVHHAVWGWMRPQSLYFLEKLHQIAPMASEQGSKIIEAGGRLKTAIASAAPELFGITLPVGLGLYSWAAINLYNNVKDSRDFAQKAKDCDEIAAKILDAGGGTFTIFGITFTVPEELAEQVARAYQDAARQFRDLSRATAVEAAKWGGAMALPFGDLWLLYKMVEEGARLGKELVGKTCDILKEEYDLYSTLGLGVQAALILAEAKTNHCAWAQ